MSEKRVKFYFTGEYSEEAPFLKEEWSQEYVSRMFQAACSRAGFDNIQVDKVEFVAIEYDEEGNEIAVV